MLDLRGNSIATLPPDLKFLRSLLDLDLEGNPIGPEVRGFEPLGMSSQLCGAALPPTSVVLGCLVAPSEFSTPRIFRLTRQVQGQVGGVLSRLHAQALAASMRLTLPLKSTVAPHALLPTSLCLTYIARKDVRSIEQLVCGVCFRCHEWPTVTQGQPAPRRVSQIPEVLFALVNLSRLNLAGTMLGRAQGKQLEDRLRLDELSVNAGAAAGPEDADSSVESTPSQGRPQQHGFEKGGFRAVPGNKRVSRPTSVPEHRLPEIRDKVCVS